MTGKKRSDRAKFITSQKLKGKSNFQGKHHNIDTKIKMAEKKYGNDWNKEKIWAYNSKIDKEIRINNLALPPIFPRKNNPYIILYLIDLCTIVINLIKL